MIKCMKAHLARHGIPDKLMYTETRGIEHDTSSPLYPESNGFAEKTSRLPKVWP